MKPPINNPIATPNDQQPKIAALYARVSTANQEDEQTIDVQIAEVKERIKADGNILRDENIFLDNGWSGAILQRPALDNMRASAANKSFDVLYVFDRGRLARKYHYQAIVIEELEDKEIQFISLNDRSVENDDDRVMQGVQGLFAEWERTKIAERFRIGRLQRAKTGRLINGQALYGYSRIKKTDTEPAYIIINEEQAQVVRMIFDWFVNEGCSLHEVTRRLYKLEIQPPKNKSKKWTKGPIERLLKCETYFNGLIHYNKSEAIVPHNPLNKSKYKKIKKSSRRMRPKEEWLPHPVPKIFPDNTLFEKAQKRFELNKKFARRNQKYEYLLTGMAWCAECGYRRVGDVGGSSNHYYRCAQRVYKHPEPTECCSSGVNAVALDTTFWQKFKEFMEKPELSREHAEAYLQQSQANPFLQQQQTQFQHNLASIEDEEQRYIKAYGAGNLSELQFNQVIKDTRKRRAHLEKQLNDLHKEIERKDVDPLTIDDLITQLRETLQTTDLSIKRQVIQDVVSKVSIGKNTVDVYGNVTLCKPHLALKGGLKNETWNRGLAERWEIDAF